MSKHTPGPWTFSTSSDGWSYSIYIAQADGAPYTPNYSDVAYITQTCTGERQQVQEANARLIAAAPDMLDALRRAVLALAFASETSAAMHDDYEAVSRAIAKATGAE